MSDHFDGITAIWSLPSQQCSSVVTSSTQTSHGRIVAFGSRDRIVVLDSRFNLITNLDFADGYPSSRGKDWFIQALAIDPSNATIVASSHDHVVGWTAVTTSTRAKTTWKVAFSFRTLYDVRSIAIHQDCMLLGGPSLSLWRQERDSRMARWTRQQEHGDFPGLITTMALSPCQTFLATQCQNSNVAWVWRITGSECKLISKLWHPDRIASLYWRSHCDPKNAILLTLSKSAVFRLFSAMIDEPDLFALSLTAQHPYSASQVACSIYLDAQTTAEASRSNPNADTVVTLFRDGTIGVLDIQRIGHSPPACLTQNPVHFHAHMGIPLAALPKLHRASVSVLHFFNLKSPVYDGAPSITILSWDRTSCSLTTIELPFSACLDPDPPKSTCHTYANRLQDDLVSWKQSKNGRWIVTMTASQTTLWEARASSQGQTLRVDPIAVLPLVATCAAVDDHHVALYDGNGSTCIYAFSHAHAHDATVQHVATISLDTATVDPVTSLMWVHEPCYELVSTTEQGTYTVYRQVGGAWQEVHHQSISGAKGVDTMKSLPVLSACSDRSVSIYSKGQDEVASHDATIQLTSSVVTALFEGDRYLAVVVASGNAYLLQIWDTVQSVFTSGLLYQVMLQEIPKQASWYPAAAGGCPILALVTADKIQFYLKRRLEYFREESTWFCTEMASPAVPLSAVMWLPDSSLLVASQNQMLLLRANLHNSMVVQARSMNGPLPLYHPQVIEQFLLFDKMHMVETIFSLIAKSLTAPEPTDYLEQALRDLDCIKALNETTFSTDDTFWLQLKTVTEHALDHLTSLRPKDVIHLKKVAQIYQHVKQQQRALDPNGTRYLVAMHSFISYVTDDGTVPVSDSISKDLFAADARRLRYRDMMWSLFSESQDLLVQESIDAFGGKCTWQTARALGLFLWIHSQEALVNQMEAVAKTMFTLGEERDPINCSLFYFALRRRRLVLSIWKQSTQHPDRPAMLKFLANNFDEPRWKTAASKNAFALLTKQRFMFAAAFFLLADKLKDCVNVILRHLKDFQLAVAIARVYEGNNKGPVLRWIIEEHVIPIAMSGGHRRLATWAFWTLGRRDLAIQAVISPFHALSASLPKSVENISIAFSDDPSLAILFAHLRDFSLQTIAGASKVPLSTEYKFVSFMGFNLRELGCHLLSMDLVSSWKFTYMPPPRANGHGRIHSEDEDDANGQRRRSLTRRRSSILGRREHGIKMDLDSIPSVVQSRSTSPTPMADPESANILKQAKKQVEAVPEFNLDAFGF